MKLAASDSFLVKTFRSSLFFISLNPFFTFIVDRYCRCFYKQMKLITMEIKFHLFIQIGGVSWNSKDISLSYICYHIVVIDKLPQRQYSKKFTVSFLTRFFAAAIDLQCYAVLLTNAVGNINPQRSILLDYLQLNDTSAITLR